MSTFSKLVYLASLLLVTSATAVATEFDWKRVAKSEPDECYNGFGEPYLPISECDSHGTPKRNHTYAWSLTRSGRHLWIGTGANITHIARSIVGQGSEIETDELVVEGAASQYPGIPDALRPFLGDWRPPQVWVYDTLHRNQTNVTPVDPRLDYTIGLRSAGAHDGVVLLGGPTLYGLGINLFAFDAETFEYLGSTTDLRFSNIRKWLAVKGQLYTGVQLLGGDRINGAVLRWTGDRDDPFRFEVVGMLDNDAANLAEHKGRIFVGTWSPTPLSSLASLPDIDPEAPRAGIWMSPRIPPSGLKASDATAWTVVWRACDYEPDNAIALSYGVGELRSYEGYLYWGTMNPPFTGLVSLLVAYGGVQDFEVAETNSRRALAVFRGRRFLSAARPPEIELLYGESHLYQFTPPSEGTPESWQLVPNNMSMTPLYGASGFDNPNNLYTWSSSVFEGQLFFGLNEFIEDDFTTGADLWRFPSADEAAISVDSTGLTTPLNEGVRVMTVTADALFLGMTNGANLSPDGGWELLELLRTDGR